MLSSNKTNTFLTIFFRLLVFRDTHVPFLGVFLSWRIIECWCSGISAASSFFHSFSEVQLFCRVVVSVRILFQSHARPNEPCLCSLSKDQLIRESYVNGSGSCLSVPTTGRRYFSLRTDLLPCSLRSFVLSVGPS